MMHYLIYLYRYKFAIEMLLYTAVATHRFPRRRYWWLAAAGTAGLCALASFHWTAELAGNIFMYTLRYTTITLIVIGGIYSAFQVPQEAAFFCGTVAVTIQSIAGRILRILWRLSSIQADWFTIVTYLAVTGFALAAIGYYFVHIVRIEDMAQISNRRFGINAIAYIIVLMALRTDNGAEYPLGTFLRFSLYDILASVGMLLISYFTYLNVKIGNELTLMQQLWHKDKERMELSRENIDLINMKCHDIRHRLQDIHLSSRITGEQLQELEQAIRIYDCSVSTGNDVLDYILTERSLACQKNNILLTCMVDGNALSFLDASELYSIFGNALDNAIEAVSKLSDEKKRVIELSVHSEKGFVLIHVGNSYDGSCTFRNGLPETTKEDKAYHGFGLKSILYTVRKHSGDMAVTGRDNFFDLDITIPVSTTHA